VISSLPSQAAKEVVAAVGQTNTPLVEGANPPPLPLAMQSTPAKSMMAASVVVPITNHPINIALAWDASPDPTVTGYRVFFGVQPSTYTNSVSFGNVTCGTISNLARATTYYFAATAHDAAGVESPLSNETFWPQPYSNYVTVAVSRRSTLADTGTVVWSQTLTNPPGDSAFFETTIRQTNDAVSVLRINTSTLLVANTNQP
jgi:hypothetical protein